MAKRSNQKLKLLYLSKILTENTDERNAMTMLQILHELERVGVHAERKSIYDDIEALRIFGIDVQTTRDRYVKYYVAKNGFDPAELRLIFDLLNSSGLVTESKSRELMKKLDAPLSSQLFAYTDTTPVLSEDSFKNLSVICSAISSDKKIRFKCFEWNTKKQRVVLLDGEYLILSPVRLLMTNGHYEVECFNEQSGTYSLYRLDRMVNLSLVNVKRATTLPSDNSERKTERVRLRCNSSLISDVFDRFGFDLTVLSDRDNQCEISVKTEISSSLFAWVFTRGGAIKIIEPEWVKSKYAEMLRNNQTEDEKK